MSPPRLNRMLALEETERLADGAGGARLEWREIGRLWCAVTAVSGAERAGEFVRLATASYRIVCRAAPEGSVQRPRPEQRFRDGGRVFRIVAVAEADSGGRYLTCFAREEVVA